MRAHVSVLFLSAAAGCHSFGPDQLDDGHLLYNAAVKEAADTEILLNIVRLRYLDTIEFMSANSISAQSSFSTAVGGSFGESGFGDGFSQALIIPEVRYSNTPTFTFTPQRGEAFARRLLEPVPLETLVHLASSTWDVAILVRLLVREINGITNEAGRANPAFNDMAAETRTLIEAGELVFGFVEEVDSLSGPVPSESVAGADIIAAAKAGFRFEPTADGSAYILKASRKQAVLGFRRESESGAGFRSALDLREATEGLPYYPIRSGRDLDTDDQPEDQITVRTRSLLDALVYLAGGVEVPEEDVEAGLVEEHWMGLEGPALSEGFFLVHTSTSRPDAHLAVRHRGRWFFVDDSDVHSRAAFLELAELFRLHLWESNASGAPVLTLPVSG